MNNFQKLWRLLVVASMLAGALNLSLIPATPAKALSTNIVLSQVYGGGGGSTGYYIYDYVELFNLGSSPVNIGGWSVQYGSSTGNFGSSTSNIYAFPAGTTIQANKYLLVQLGAAGTGGIAFPVTPDLTTTNLAMGAASGKVALANIATGLSCGATATPCALPDSRIVDSVSYGASNNGEGGTTVNNGVALTNQQGGVRKMAGCTETDNNNADFDVALGAALLMRNGSSAAHSCAATPNLSINDVSAVETNSGTTIFTFTVALDMPAQAGGVTFDIATAAGTATADDDYDTRSLPGQFIPAGSSDYTFDVTVNGDTDVEPNETFFVNVTNVTGATVSDGQGQGTIQNDDVALPVLSINDVTHAEGNSGTVTYQFTVSMDKTSASAVTFNIDTADDTATIADSDYAALSTAGTITAGELSTTVDVTVNGDANIEPTETFQVNLSNPSGATIGDGMGLGTITNDDAATPQISISNVGGAESDAGTTTLSFNVSLDIPALAGGVTFDIATSDGTATDADNDYEPNSVNGVTIPAGESNYLFHVTVNGDAKFEADETFTVTLSNVTGATVANSTGTGTIQNDDAAPVNLSVADVTLAEGNTGTTTFGFLVTLDGPAPTGGVTFDVATSAGTATADTDYVSKSVNGASIATGSTTYNFDVTVNGDWDNETNETFNVTVSNVTGASVTDGAAVGTITNDDTAVTPIHDIQTSGSASASGTFTVDAIVVGDYQAQTSGQLKGFFIQEQDADIDADPATSEGIFVYCNTCPDAVSVGDRVRVTAASSEYFNMSQLNAVTAGNTVVLSSGNTLPTPASLTLPIPGVPTGDLAAAETVINAYYEKYEGMLVKFPATLSVSEYFELARYGQVILSAGGRPHTFTAVNTPTATGYINHQIDLAARSIILDDPDNRQNRPSDAPNTAYFYPQPGLSTTNYFRGGDTITNLTGVLHWSFAGQTGTDAWRIRPVTEQYSYTFTPVNTRPTVPAPSGRLTVASFNVLNYFLTIDTSNVCAPTQNQDCRGADSAQELDRQRTKMLAALTAIDADVFGFMEMENTPGVEPLADIVNIVDGLPGYDYIDTGVIGGDAIRVGIIYKTSTVTPVGAFKLLTSTVDPLFDDTKNRPALAQTFEEKATGEIFTVVVNHLKSKGSSCGAGDDDTTTGQGNCNLTRTEAAEALADWLDTDPTNSGDPDFLIIGDLNSYAMEDPITALKTAGYTDMVAQFGGSDAYGYVFDGQLGYLDHALGNASLLSQVTGVAEWHINSDENPLFDYNDDVRTADEAAYDEESDVFPLYDPGPYRTSDHDPIIISLDLGSSKIMLTVTASSSTITYGGTPTVTPQYAGFVDGDTAAVLNTAPTCTAGAGPFTVSGSPYTTSCSGGVDDKYDFTYAPGTLTVNPKALTITASSTSKFYGQTKTFSGLEFFPNGLVNGDAVSSVTLTTAGAPASAAASSYNIVPSAAVGTGLGNYNITYINGTLTVSKAYLDVVPDDKTKAFGAADPTFTFALSGLQNGETAAVIDTAPTCSVLVAHGIPGTYPIVCSGGLDNNYDFAGYAIGTLTVSGLNAATFTDVPMNHWAWKYVESLFAFGITGGCGNGNFCPSTAVTRDQMAVFLLKAKYGVSYNPPAVGASTGFNDVPVSYWAAPWIKQLAAEGVTAGCGDGNYCPTLKVTRDQMAVFLLKTKYGISYTPPAVGASTGFNDVPASYWAAPWIKQLAVEGVTGGCGNGNYCPTTVVSRDQMSVFLVATFNLPTP